MLFQKDANEKYKNPTEESYKLECMIFTGHLYRTSTNWVRGEGGRQHSINSNSSTTVIIHQCNIHVSLGQKNNYRRQLNQDDT